MGDTDEYWRTVHASFEPLEIMFKKSWSGNVHDNLTDEQYQRYISYEIDKFDPKRRHTIDYSV
jgi:hypothetical protein